MRIFYRYVLPIICSFPCAVIIIYLNTNNMFRLMSGPTSIYRHIIPLVIFGYIGFFLILFSRKYAFKDYLIYLGTYFASLFILGYIITHTLPIYTTGMANDMINNGFSSFSEYKDYNDMPNALTHVVDLYDGDVKSIKRDEMFSWSEGIVIINNEKYYINFETNFLVKV